MSHQLDFLPAAVEILERPPSPVGRTIAWVVAAFFSIAIAWAVIGRIDIVVTARGRVVPSGHVKVIQPLEIGVVRHVHVQEGQRVQAGDLLIELDPTASLADLGRLETDLMSARLDRSRYFRLERQTRASADSLAQTRDIELQLPAELAERAGVAALALHEQMLKTAWSEQRARLTALDSTIDSREAELAALESEVRRLERTLPLITRRADALKSLLARQLASEQTWLELEEKRVEQEQDLAVRKNRARQVGASIREARQQREAAGAAFRHQVLTRLAETDRRIEQLQQEHVKATRRASLQQLTAPVSGVAQQLAVHTIGGVVTPAQALMKIVPDTENLEIETWILNKDIGFVDAGQVAEIKVETFPFTRYGTLSGELIDVSDDAVTDEDQGMVYAGRVLLRQSVMQIGAKPVRLSPGMAVVVEIRTGTRRLIEFFLGPLLRYRQESLRER